MLLTLNWTAADLRQKITAGQVHVWAWPIHPNHANFAQRDLQILDAGEQDRFRRYHFEVDRLRFAMAHVHVRRILGAYLDCEPERVSQRADRLGKPVLAAGGPLHFNLSHSRTFAMLAISTETAVGVDIEDVRPIEPDVAQHYFSLREQAELASLKGGDWLDGFFRCWTRKEAILKAEGVGLHLSLSSFDVSLLPGVPAALLGVRPPAVFTYPWKLHHLETPNGTMAALAAGNPEATVFCFRPENL